MMREFEHRNLIFNSVPTYMGDRRSELSSHKIESCHLIFTIERGRDIVDLLLRHKTGRSLDGPARRVGRR